MADLAWDCCSGTENSRELFAPTALVARIMPPASVARSSRSITSRVCLGSQQYLSCLFTTSAALAGSGRPHDFMSYSIISYTSSLKEHSGSQPPSFLALEGSPNSVSTSVGRKYLDE